MKIVYGSAKEANGMYPGFTREQVETPRADFGIYTTQTVGSKWRDRRKVILMLE